MLLEETLGTAPALDRPPSLERTIPLTTARHLMVRDFICLGGILTLFAVRLLTSLQSSLDLTFSESTPGARRL